MFIAVLFIIIKKLEIYKVFINCLMDKQIVIYSFMDYYSAIKRNKLMIHNKQYG